MIPDKRFILALFLLLLPLGISAQTLLTAENMALGGGGTAYLTGYESSFLNPANLVINEHDRTFRFGAGSGGFIFKPVTSSGGIGEFAGDFLNVYRPHATNQPLNPALRKKIIEQNYPDTRQLLEQQNNFDLILAGVKWHRGDMALSFAVRMRAGTRTETGRGWYEEQFFLEDSLQVRNQDLVHQKQFLYEISLGFAREFDFINGLNPHLGKLYIGFSPKFVIGGGFTDLRYQGEFELGVPTSQSDLLRSFNYKSSGDMSAATLQYLQSNDPINSINQNLENGSLTNPTGYGAGFDFGLTYVIPIGSDSEVIAKRNKNHFDKSVRVGISITDIGFVSYTENPLFIQIERDTTVAAPPTATEYPYNGEIGEFLPFFNRISADINPFQNIESSDSQSFSAPLPMAFNGGVMIQLNRIKAVGDLSIGVNKTAFNDKRLNGHFGLEFRPFKPLPVRLGTHLAADSPAVWSLGTGFESENFIFTVSSRFISRSNTSDFEIAGAALAGITLLL